MSDLSVTREALDPARSRSFPSQLFRPGAVRAREASGCSHAARATSATSSRCPRSATTTPCRRKARAARWCARRDGVELISNVCRHRQAVMLRGRGNTGSNIVCPLHRWTYDLQGRADRRAALRRRPLPEPAPTTRCRPGTACCSRPRRHGRDVAADLAGLGPRADLDFTGYVLDQRPAARVRLQLEDLHRGLPRGLPRRPVPPRARPVRHLRRPALGVRRRTTRCRPSAPKNELAKPGSPAYRKWHDAVLALPQTATPPQARRDLADLLPERDGRVVPARAGGLDAASRKGPQKTLNVVEFYYPEEIAPSSASSSRPSRRPTWRPASRTTRSRCAWTPAGGRCCERGDDEAARTRARWKTACSTSTSGTGETRWR